MTAPGGEWVEAAAFAADHNVDARTVRNWIRDGMPAMRAARGKYLVQRAAANAWRDARQKSATAPTDEADARARKLAAEAELKELELAKARGELVTVEDAARAVEEQVRLVRAALLAAPGQWAPYLIGLQTAGHAQAVLDDLTREALERVSQGGDDADDAP